MSNNAALTDILRNPSKRAKWGKRDLEDSLNFIVEMANEIPKDFEAPEVLRNPLRAQELAWEEIRNSPKWKALLRRLKNRKRHSKPAGWGFDEDDALRFLRYLCALPEFLLAIIDADPGDSIPISPWLRNSEEIQITVDGFLWVKQDMDFAKAIYGLSFRNKELIRLCGTCKRIFIANRPDKKVCSKACRVRKSRELHLDRYLTQEARRAEKEKLHYREGKQKRKERETGGAPINKPGFRKPRPGGVK